MTVEAATLEALALSVLSLPDSPPVIGVTAEEYTDNSGDPALRVLVTLDEKADIENLRGGDISELKSAIRESLKTHGIDLFPYIFLAKQSELAEQDDSE